MVSPSPPALVLCDQLSLRTIGAPATGPSNPPTRARRARPTQAIFRSLSLPGEPNACRSIGSWTSSDIAPGKNVADIGAGSGWFTVRAAKRVRASGSVYAVDINPEAIRYIEDRSQKEQLHNVKAILGHEDDPLLPAGQVDAVLLLKTYHEVAKPVALLRNLRASLRPGRRSESSIATATERIMACSRGSGPGGGRGGI